MPMSMTKAAHAVPSQLRFLPFLTSSFSSCSHMIPIACMQRKVPNRAPTSPTMSLKEGMALESKVRRSASAQVSKEIRHQGEHRLSH